MKTSGSTAAPCGGGPLVGAPDAADDLAVARAHVSRARRVIVKLGSAVVTDRSGAIALGVISSLAESLGRARASGRQVVLVTSGAVAVGASRLGRAVGSRTRSVIPACAAVGQGYLMGLYAELFARCGVEIAQVLVSQADVAEPSRLTHLGAVLRALTRRGVLPILNENDVVSGGPRGRDAVRRLRDNDHLAALVAPQWSADLLLLLSSVDGLMAARSAHRSGGPLQVVPRIDARTSCQPTLWPSAGPGRGGMESKLAAAQQAAMRGTTVVIANGRTPGIVDRILAGERVGTGLAAETCDA